VGSGLNKTVPGVDDTAKSFDPNLNDSNGLESSFDDIEEEKEFKKRRIIKKVAPIIDSEIEPEFSWISKFPRHNKINKTNINDVLQLVPHRGLLKPNEIQYVHVIFRPKLNINVRAILECEVLGGPPETVIVTGQSSDLMYKINTDKLNFKIRSFHENAAEELTLLNIAQLPFEYKTYLNEPKFDNELRSIILDIVPPEKILDPEEESQIQIVVRPGVVGYFNRIFLLEIGHLPHIPIEVFGWGVIPQVHISLPRPGLIKVSIGIILLKICN
jgi:hypothetical protein